jgi:protoheme IX farnesyltransferase
MRSTIEYGFPDWFFYRAVEILRCYLLLTKPRIVFLVSITALSAMVLEGTLLSAPLKFAAVLLGIILTAAAAGALNQYFDRDIDAVMARTRNKRPIPAGMIRARSALLFGVGISIPAIALLNAAGNMMAVTLAVGSMVWYIVIYTKWLKRKTPLNIVVGGAAGAAAPLIGWAAGAGELALVPWCMFLVIFLWTPAHFWSLALYTKEEYAQAGIPMLPVTAGAKITRLHITVYALLLVPATLCLGILADLNTIFFAGAIVMGVNLIRKVIMLRLEKSVASARALFSYSNLYIAVIFALTLASRW